MLTDESSGCASQILSGLAFCPHLPPHWHSVGCHCRLQTLAASTAPFFAWTLKQKQSWTGRSFWKLRPMRLPSHGFVFSLFPRTWRWHIWRSLISFDPVWIQPGVLRALYAETGLLELAEWLLSAAPFVWTETFWLHQHWLQNMSGYRGGRQTSQMPPASFRQTQSERSYCEQRLGVISGAAVHTWNAVYLPIPANDETVSHPLKAWNIGSALDRSSPILLAILCAGYISSGS